MEQINQYVFYEIGKGLKSALNLQDSTPATDALWPLWDSQTAVEKLLDAKFFPLKLSRHEAEQIKSHLDDIFLNHFQAANSDGTRSFRYPEAGDPPVPYWRFSGLRTAITSFEKVFGAELRGAATYFVPSKGIFATPLLIDNADEAFTADIRDMVPQKSRDEWKQAGRCLALSLWSASGFHVARAVEGALEKYHAEFCPAGKKGLLLWKDYIEDFKSCLAGQTQSSPSSRVIVAIEQMKDDYRNPLMHPRVVLNELDARMLLANGESLIICMVQEMQIFKRLQASPAPPQPSKPSALGLVFAPS